MRFQSLGLQRQIATLPSTGVIPYPIDLKRFGLAALLAVGLAGCSTASIPGPRLSRVPQGVELRILPDRCPTVFPDRELLDQRGYVSAQADPVLRLTTYRGAATYGELLEAWADLAGQGNADLGPVEALSLKQRSAWGWRTIEKGDGTGRARTYTAVILDPEADRTYTVEYHAAQGDPVHESEMKHVIESFTLRRTEVSAAKIGLAAVLTAGLATVVAGARRLRA